MGVRGDRTNERTYNYRCMCTHLIRNESNDTNDYDNADEFSCVCPTFNRRGGATACTSGVDAQESDRIRVC